MGGFLTPLEQKEPPLQDLNAKLLRRFSSQELLFYSKEGESSALQCGDEAFFELENSR